MRRTYEDPVEEDLTGQAGWMYTDLMLALMVIFLATISFVPQFAGSSNATADPNNPNYSYSKIFDESMNTLYEGFNLSQIKADIAKFKSSHGLPSDSDIIYAQYVGGYSTSNENPSIAIARALEFSKKLDSADHELLASAATTLSSSNVLRTNQVIVRFTFATPSKIGQQ
jgi:hypothetical protein